LLSLVFAYIYISQSGVKTHLPYSGMYGGRTVAGCLRGVKVGF